MPIFATPLRVVTRGKSPASRRLSKVGALERGGARASALDAKIVGLQPAAAEAAAETGDRRGVDLGDPSLGDIENSSDLLHRELFVIVEAEDAALGRRKLVDERGEQCPPLPEADLIEGIGGVLDERRRGEGVVGVLDVPGVSGGMHAEAQRAERVMILIERHLKPRGDLLVGGFTEEFLLQGADGALDVSSLGADGSGDRVERAQIVEDRAADPGCGVGGKLGVAVGIVGLDRGEQSGDAGGFEIGGLEVRRETEGEAASNTADEVNGAVDQRFAESRIARRAKLTPEGPEVLAPRIG
jgi:hypothetical protein